MTAAAFRIPAENVSESLSNFPVRVELRDLPSTVWDDILTNGVGSIRVSQGGSDVPLDVVWVNTTSRTGEVYALLSISSATDTSFKVYTEPGLTARALTDPLGRNAVWAEYDFFLHGLDSSSDRAGKVTVTPTGAVVSETLSGGLEPTLKFTSALFQQGVAVDPSGNLYASGGESNLLLAKTTSTGQVIMMVENVRTEYGVPQNMASFNHVSGITWRNNEVYLLVEQYTNNPYNNQHVLVLDDSDLSFKRRYDISANLHEVSDICFAGDGYAYISEYASSGTNRIHKYDPDTFAYVAAVTLPVPVLGAQGITWDSGYFYMMSGPLTGSSKLIKIKDDMSSGATIWIGASHKQGLATAGPNRLLMANSGGSVSEIDLTQVAQLPGWLTFAGGYVDVVGLPRRASFTVGATVIPSNVGANAGVATVHPQSTASGNRTSMLLAANSNSRFGLWNSTNTYLTDPSITLSEALGKRTRLHMIQDDATARHIFRDGALRASGPTASRPAGTTPTVSLLIGAGTASSEKFSGSMNYLYVRNGVSSNSRIAAEQSSWELGGFYELEPEPDTSIHGVVLSGILYRASLLFRSAGVTYSAKPTSLT